MATIQTMGRRCLYFRGLERFDSVNGMLYLLVHLG
jgi:hypothetical protein